MLIVVSGFVPRERLSHTYVRSMERFSGYLLNSVLKSVESLRAEMLNFLRQTCRMNGFTVDLTEHPFLIVDKGTSVISLKLNGSELTVTVRVYEGASTNVDEVQASTLGLDELHGLSLHIATVLS